jgi:hypothetical protein
MGRPDWQPYEFAEWYGKDYLINIRMRNGQVITAGFRLLRDQQPSVAPLNDQVATDRQIGRRATLPVARSRDRSP